MIRYFFLVIVIYLCLLKVYLFRNKVSLKKGKTVEL